MSYYLLCFFFNKIGVQEGGTGSAQKVGGQSIHVSKCKNDKIKKIKNFKRKSKGI
jgi:hypothetical protein